MDGSFASFTVNGSSGYAATTAHEPAPIVMLAIGLVGLLAFAWRCRWLCGTP
jgi:hypothetical protein